MTLEARIKKLFGLVVQPPCSAHLWGWPEKTGLRRCLRCQNTMTEKRWGNA